MFRLLFLCLLQTPVESDYYQVDYLQPPQGEVLEIGGMDFLSDGTLLVSTRRGRVWWIDHALDPNPQAAQFHIFAEGLHEGLGLKVVDDQIYVVQRGELSKLVDLDGDHICDRVEVVSQAWGMSGNYHEFAYGLPVDADGNFYLSTNVGFWSPEWWHGLSRAPFRGWIWKISPQGEAEPWACGARSPAGLGRDAEGNIFYTDNQGDWMPVCGLFPVEKGAFYGHPASLRWTEAYGNGAVVPSSTEPPATKRTPPAVWIPYEWSRSTGNFVSDLTGGQFGPFSQQLFLAELTNGLVFRCMLEEVQGRKQGAVVLFRQQIGSVFRVRFAPDGTLFAGMTNRGWGGYPPGDGIARIRWQKNVPMEYQSVHLEKDGFRLGFTKPLTKTPQVEEIAVRDYDYNWWWDYGSPEMRGRSLQVEKLELSADGRSLRLWIPNLKAGRNVRLGITGVGLLHEELDYTINQMPTGQLVQASVAKKVQPPQERAHDEEGWLTLTWGNPWDAWTGEGWQLVDATLDPADPTKFLLSPGNGALVNVGPNCKDFRSLAEFGDLEFRFQFMLPEHGDSGLYFMDRYELQLVDDPSACCGVIGAKGPRAKGYRGPGQWHVVEGKFFAPRFDKEGNKIADARFEEIRVDGVMVIGATTCDKPTGGAVSMEEVPMGPLRFQATAGLAAIGDIRVRALTSAGQEVPADADDLAWQDFAFDQELGTNFELQGQAVLSDGGVASLDFISQDGAGPAWSIALNHTVAGKARTGSIGTHLLRTQFLQPEIPFTWRLRSRQQGPQTHLWLWLNQILVQEVVLDQSWADGHVQLRAIAPETELHFSKMQWRGLPSQSELGPVQVLWAQGDPLTQGWAMSGPGAFVVDGDVLKTTGGMGLLWYRQRQYKDFQLDLEWKVERKENNSGVFVRFPNPGDDPWVAVHHGYEIQICDVGDATHNTGSIYSFQASTSVPTLEPGQWNHYRLRVNGQHYQVFVNEVLVNEFEGKRGHHGYIGLQNHDDTSPVRFRNIRIAEILP